MRVRTVVIIASACLALGGVWLYAEISGSVEKTAVVDFGNVPERPDLTRCDQDKVAATYISATQLDGLRKAYAANSASAPFDDLSLSQRAVLGSALSLGPERAFFAARLLRSAEIVRQLDLQASCMVDSACGTGDTDLIDNLKTGGPFDPNKEVSWVDLGKFWRTALKQDIDVSRPCFVF